MNSTSSYNKEVARVMGECSRNHLDTRIHAIVLTRNRPKTLQRCLATILSSLGPQDLLTILDDSLPAISSANAALLAITPTTPAPTRVHLSTLCLGTVLANSMTSLAPCWLSKTVPRDISPLRNLSLLLSIAAPAQTTVLIDDDIHGFDLVATHCKISMLIQSNRGVIAGANIVGINELDTITKLTDAISMLKKKPTGVKARSIRDLFQVEDSFPSGIERNSRYVSAGYLAFRLPLERIFAFPPGYNEDWLWCLLHGGDMQVRTLRTGEAVVHDPPSVRRPTREDFLFELIGDLVFDCLEEQQSECDLNPGAVLTDLSERTPSTASMPSYRAIELLDKAQSLSQNEGSLFILKEYGLTVLAEMLRDGELELNGKRVLSNWCSDAIEKQKSFAATLQNESVIPTLRKLLQERSF